MRAYANTWAARRDELSFELNQANNGVFVGGITAALAGLRQSVEGTRIGALIGGGSALFADHFKIATQRDNYRQGAQLMGCIEDELASIPSTLWDEYFTGDGAYKGQTGNDGYKSIATIRDTTIATMNKVIRKLGDSQGVIAFSTPDQATLKEAFAKYAEAKTNAGTNAKTIALALQKSENGKEQIINEYELAKLIALPAGIKTCMPAS